MSNISLYCLPYSGGSAAMYYKWRSVLSDNITLRPLEPAGRGTRIRQPLCPTMADAVADLYQQFAKHDTGVEYAIFGHSLGSIMAFELVHYILEHGHDMPRALFFPAAARPIGSLTRQYCIPCPIRHLWKRSPSSEERRLMSFAIKS